MKSQKLFRIVPALTFLIAGLFATYWNHALAQSCGVAPETGGDCWTTEDVLHSQIDHHAQSALFNMFGSGGNSAADASAILCAVKSGELEGIFLPDQKVPALRAQAAGSGWWLIIPEGQLSTCFQEPAGQPPLIAFRKQIKDNRALVMPAITAAFDQCGLVKTQPRCYVATINKPPPEPTGDRVSVLEVFVTLATMESAGPAEYSTVDVAGNGITVTRAGPQAGFVLEAGDYTVSACAMGPSTNGYCDQQSIKIKGDGKPELVVFSLQSF